MPESNQTPESKSIYDPGISLSEYEALRKGESVPADKVDEKKKEESDTSKEDLEAKSDESDESDDVDSEDQDDEKEELNDKPKKKNGFKKRIDKLNSRLSAKDQELEYWKKQALETKTKAETQEPLSKKEAIKDLSGKPKADDFDTHEDYVEAVTDWKIEQKEKERESKLKETEVKTDFQKKVESFQSNVQKFKESHDDFEEVVEAIDDIAMSVGSQETILSSDMSADLMYWFGKNKEEYIRINSLSPLMAAKEIGRIEARLSESQSSNEEKKPVEKKLTKAQAPMKTLNSKGNGTVKKSIFDKELSFTEYESLRMQELKNKG